MQNSILGGITTTHFLKHYWQKKPLLIRHAFPEFSSILTKDELTTLAAEEDVQSRLVQYQRGQWHLQDGPFTKRHLKNLSGKWTLLVQDVNHHVVAADTLLRKFNFIPYARLDDLMISYAVNGAGVGPHIDSYDVFLLQGLGKRKWQISKQTDQRLLENCPLRILKKFTLQQEWILEPGDMLYLPPNYAHNGIAMGECMTYSIGFRAPSYQSLTHDYLNYLQDFTEIAGIYADPNLCSQKHPALISPLMLKEVTKILQQIDMSKAHMEKFVGMFLTEPKSHVYFSNPENALTLKQFVQSAEKFGVCLSLKSNMLYTTKAIFINGDEVQIHPELNPALQKLANERHLLLNSTSNKQLNHLLYEWYKNGYIEISH